METNNVQMADIPAEKFKFVEKSDLAHDKKLETKPVGYFKGAFKRLSKTRARS